jgi:iron(III) transport system permease protein
MFLNLSASIANLDPVYDEAAQSLGASFFHRLRTVTLPLVLPGYFAGAILVFLWAMTDLGTPLIFDYSRVIPMMIFNMITDMYSNPMGYSLVVFILMLTISSFWISKRWAGGKNYEMYTRGYMQPRETNLWKSKKYLPLLLIYGYLLVLLFISSLPHIGVLLNSLADEWFMTILPEKWTFKHYTEVFTHPLALSSIKMSLLLSISSTVLDVLLGLGIAYLVTRKKIKGAAFLDSLTMLTLTIPGIILAFGYISCFSGTFLDPRIFPVPLLILAYSIRRLPYMVRSAYAGFLQSSMTLEEASASLGASSSYTFFKITLPLVFSHVLVGGLMCFAFAMLEVSDSLILAMQEKYYPITKTIWYLSGRSGDGLYLASAMGVLGMILLCVTFLISSKFLGKKLGDLFKVS